MEKEKWANKYSTKSPETYSKEVEADKWSDKGVKVLRELWSTMQKWFETIINHETENKLNVLNIEILILYSLVISVSKYLF